MVKKRIIVISLIVFLFILFYKVNDTGKDVLGEKDLITTNEYGLNINVPEFSKVELSWDSGCADKVYIEWSADNSFEGGGKKVVNSSENSYNIQLKNLWGDYSFRFTPIIDNKKGEPVVIQDDVWENYRPAGIEYSKTKYTISENRFPDVKVYLNNGEVLSKEYYEVKPAPAKTGNQNAYVVFKDKYKKIDNISVPCTIIPDSPSTFTVSKTTKSTVVFYVGMNNIENVYDYCQIEISQNKDFSNAQKIKTKNTKSSADNLSSGKTYYARAKYVKEINGSKFESDYYDTSFKTQGSIPTSKSSTTKNILSNIKKNKTFVIYLPNNLSMADTYNYVDNLLGPYPQYDKFDRKYNFENGSVSSVTMKYDAVKAKKAKQTKNKINKIVKKAKKKKGTKNKIKYVNEQLCKISSYHYAASKLARGEDTYPDAYTAYGCLIQKKAVCKGYSRAFQAIMTELKIPVKTVSSSNHMWNKVKVNGKWLHVDVTWNDCSGKHTKYLLKKSHK